MAWQLHAAGQKLDLLVLMDPMGLVYPAHNRLSRAFISLLGKLSRSGEEKQVNWYILLRHWYNSLRFSNYRRTEDARPWRTDKGPGGRRDKTGLAHTKLASIFPTAAALRQDYSAIYDWAAMRYEPSGLYPGKITFFWDREEPWRRKGWSKASETNDIEVYIIPGTQMESRTQFLHVLAEHLKMCLSKAQKEEV
jgi:hypothetical protein